MFNAGTCDAWITVFALAAWLAGLVLGLGVASVIAWVCRV